MVSNKKAVVNAATSTTDTGKSKTATPCNHDTMKKRQKTGRTSKVFSNPDEFWEGKQFKHNKLGRALIQMFCISRIQKYGESYSDALLSPLMMYNQGIYDKAKPYLENIIRNCIDDLKTSQVREVAAYINDMAPVYEHKEPQLIAVKNGILDPYTGELMEQSKKHVVLNRIPVIYQPKALKAPMLYDFMATLFGQDEAMHQFIYEVFGYVLSPTNFMQKFFMLTGPGGNGKSTFLELLERFYGDWNISRLQLSKFDRDRFGTAALDGKLLNIGDDIGPAAILETAELKKAVSGEPLRVEYKGENAFYIKPRAKLFFSANELPRIYDTSQGMKDRLCVIPFVNHIRNTAKKDPEIVNKLVSDNVTMNALLNYSISGLQRIRKTRQFTLPALIEQYTARYMIDSNPVALFVEECNNGDIIRPNISGYDAPIILEETVTKDLYSVYVEWAEKNKFKPVASNKFGFEMANLGYERVQQYSGTDRGKRYYRKMQPVATGCNQ